MFEQFPALYSEAACNWVILVTLGATAYFFLRTVFAVWLDFASSLPKDAWVAFAICMLGICLIVFIAITYPPHELVKEETLTVEIVQVHELKKSYFVSLKDVNTEKVYSSVYVFKTSSISAEKLVVGRRLEIKYQIWHDPASKRNLNAWPNLRQILER